MQQISAISIARNGQNEASFEKNWTKVADLCDCPQKLSTPQDTTIFFYKLMNTAVNRASKEFSSINHGTDSANSQNTDEISGQSN